MATVRKKYASGKTEISAPTAAGTAWVSQTHLGSSSPTSCATAADPAMSAVMTPRSIAIAIDRLTNPAAPAPMRASGSGDGLARGSRVLCSDTLAFVGPEDVEPGANTSL